MTGIKTLGTFGVGQIETTYQHLVSLLGEPIKLDTRDDFKSDVIWKMYVPNTNKAVVSTIYNYKTGKNYLGDEGKEPEAITLWHVGGNHKELSLKYVKEKLGVQ